MKKSPENPIHIFLNFRRQQFEHNTRRGEEFRFPNKGEVRMKVVVDIDYKLMVFVVDHCYDGDVSLGAFAPEDSIYFLVGMKNTPTRIVFDHSQ